MIKLICSAYRKQCDSSTNALATADLIRFLARAYHVQLVLGQYEAQGEIAVEVTGFLCVEAAETVGRRVITRCQQDCVLVIDSDSDGWLISKLGLRELGKMEYSAGQPTTSGWTRYLNGTYLYAPHQAAVQDAKAA